jgi:hypothetical protein
VRPSATHLACERLEDRLYLAGNVEYGMNLSAAAPWNREWVFVDVFKQHSEWVSQLPGLASPWSTGAPLALDEQGNPLLAPGQAAGTLMMRDMASAYPGGKYLVTYEGDGDLAFGMDAMVVSRGENQITIDVKPTSAGIYLRIDRSNVADPVRDIRITMPGFENAESPFHPLFLERLEPFGVIRFMDFSRTNDSQLSRWEDRPLPDDSTQAGPNGVALETMIDLANALKADPWFTLPHLADDNFVRQFAEMVRARLDPELRIYLEWSNEVWNRRFEQWTWAADEAAARYGDSAEIARVIADEASRDWDIFLDVFQGEPERVVRVLAGQQAQPALAEQVAEYLAGEFDAVAAAAYFSPDASELKKGATARGLLESAIDNIETVTLPRLAEHKALADQWSSATGREIPLVAYEGGQHFTAYGQTVPWQSALNQAQSHPLMYKAYQRLLEGFEAIGGTVFMAYRYISQQTKYGAWGHLTTQTQSAVNAPKWQALLDAINGLFGNDVTPARSELASVGEIVAGYAGATVTVRYIDDVAVDKADLDNADIIVIGPNGFSQILLLERTWHVAGYRTVHGVYRVTAPGGTWDAADDGVYEIRLLSQAVSDTSENLAPATLLGTFQVSLAAG